MGEIPCPRFGEPDNSWVTQFGDAFKNKDDALAMAIAFATIERDVPNIVALMDYIARDDRENDSPYAWVDYSALFGVLGEAVRWTMDFQLAVSFLHSVTTFLRGKPSSENIIQYSEREELIAAVDGQIKEKGLETVYYDHLEAASRAAAEIKEIVSQTHRDLVDILKNPRPAPILTTLDSVVKQLSPKIDLLWSTQYAVMEMDRWSTAS